MNMKAKKLKFLFPLSQLAVDCAHLVQTYEIADAFAKNF
jgi:hypothetical protein